jgi:Ethanolamine utilization protein EutJ (predicted chaperonin)
MEVAKLFIVIFLNKKDVGLKLIATVRANKRSVERGISFETGEGLALVRNLAKQFKQRFGTELVNAAGEMP